MNFRNGDLVAGLGFTIFALLIMALGVGLLVLGNKGGAVCFLFATPMLLCGLVLLSCSWKPCRARGGGSLGDHPNP